MGLPYYHISHHRFYSITLLENMFLGFNCCISELYNKYNRVSLHWKPNINILNCVHLSNTSYIHVMIIDFIVLTLSKEMYENMCKLWCTAFMREKMQWSVTNFSNKNGRFFFFSVFFFNSTGNFKQTRVMLNKENTVDSCVV